MNRTAMCIRMLQMLNSRGSMNKQDIAAELKVNMRNIPEYRKELEAAGYRIEWSLGKYGGYVLQDSVLLPALGLSDEEKESLRELSEYLRSHHDFSDADTIIQIIDRMLSNTQLNTKQTGFYLDHHHANISEKLLKNIDLVRSAVKKHSCVKIEYRSISELEPKTYIIHPYSLVHFKDSYYCIAYSLSAKDYRTFKFSDERMKSCTLLDSTFSRDKHFNIEDHIGKVGLMKQQAIKIEFLAYEEAALYMAERQIGLEPHFTWIDHTTVHYETTFEGKKEALSFLLSLGAKVKLLKPTELKEEYTREIMKMMEINKNR